MNPTTARTHFESAKTNPLKNGIISIYIGALWQGNDVVVFGATPRGGGMKVGRPFLAGNRSGRKTKSHRECLFYCSIVPMGLYRFHATGTGAKAPACFRPVLPGQTRMDPFRPSLVAPMLLCFAIVAFAVIAADVFRCAARRKAGVLCNRAPDDSRPLPLGLAPRFCPCA